MKGTDYLKPFVIFITFFNLILAPTSMGYFLFFCKYQILLALIAMDVITSTFMKEFIQKFQFTSFNFEFFSDWTN